jgi:hypothetical protein
MHPLREENSYKYFPIQSRIYPRNGPHFPDGDNPYQRVGEDDSNRAVSELNYFSHIMAA